MKNLLIALLVVCAVSAEEVKEAKDVTKEAKYFPAYYPYSSAGYHYSPTYAYGMAVPYSAAPYAMPYASAYATPYAAPYATPYGYHFAPYPYHYKPFDYQSGAAVVPAATVKIDAKDSTYFPGSYPYHFSPYTYAYHQKKE